MSTASCLPFDDCQDLDGRLLISSAVHGPPIAVTLGDVSFGAFSTDGAALRPYVDVDVDQAWTAREACYGPVRSIFSLAPGETVTMSVETEQHTSLTRTVADHLPSVREASDRFGGRSVGSMVGAAAAGHVAPATSPPLIAGPAAQKNIALRNQYLAGYGSLLETFADPLGIFTGHAVGGLPTPPGPSDVSAAIVGLVQGAIDKKAPAATGVMDQASRAAQAADRLSSQHTRDETTTNVSTSTTRQSITRTFSNPYRDRSLQLRFVPVFRRYDVVTKAAPPSVGVSLHAGPVREASAELRSPVVLSDVVGDASDPALHRPIVEMLGGGAERTAVGAFRWSDANVRGDTVLVPLADAQTAAGAFGLRGRDREEFVSRVTGAASVVAALKAMTQTVHLYIGTHIEAVAGDCVLHDLPDPVPSGDA
jgi:hypothetical protein